MLKLKRGKNTGEKRWEYKKGRKKGSEKGRKKGYCEQPYCNTKFLVGIG
jgi:hypothetical protein